MLDLFKNKEAGSPDVKNIRDRLLQFIKEQLQKLEGGEGNAIRGLHLFINCDESEKFIYESAVYYDEPGRFKNEEVQKIADDYAIDLPDNWNMEIVFIEDLPGEAVKVPGLPAALFIQTRKRTLTKTGSAVITVLGGEAEQERYEVTSKSGKVTIGREKKVQAGEGYFRMNTIAFPGNSSNESNKFVSRQHAHIEWDNETGTFLLFPDEGGIPPKNKVKVRSSAGELIKLQAMEIGYELKDGDQIILGDSAVLEFNYRADK